ncbi:hypothetical protein DFH27DRAFT_523005 [Peziza echinospora]|nr:hypothetical protein DFH27DRAFT_523005 [Peziza echinospora]
MTSTLLRQWRAGGQVLLNHHHHPHSNNNYRHLQLHLHASQKKWFSAACAGGLRKGLGRPPDEVYDDDEGSFWDERERERGDGGGTVVGLGADTGTIPTPPTTPPTPTLPLPTATEDGRRKKRNTAAISAPKPKPKVVATWKQREKKVRKPVVYTQIIPKSRTTIHGDAKKKISEMDFQEIWTPAGRKRVLTVVRDDDLIQRRLEELEEEFIAVQEREFLGYPKKSLAEEEVVVGRPTDGGKRISPKVDGSTQGRKKTFQGVQAPVKGVGVGKVYPPQKSASTTLEKPPHSYWRKVFERGENGSASKMVYKKITPSVPHWGSVGSGGKVNEMPQGTKKKFEAWGALKPAYPRSRENTTTKSLKQPIKSKSKSGGAAGQKAFAQTPDEEEDAKKYFEMMEQEHTEMKDLYSEGASPLQQYDIYADMDPNITGELAADEVGYPMPAWDAHHGLLGAIEEDDENLHSNINPDDQEEAQWLKEIEQAEKARTKKKTQKTFEDEEYEMTGAFGSSWNKKQKLAEEEEAARSDKLNSLYVVPDIKIETVMGEMDTATGVSYSDLLGWQKAAAGRGSAVVMGVRIYNPPLSKPLNEGSEEKKSLPITIHFPSGLPIMVEAGVEATPPIFTTPMVLPQDHQTALLLAKESKQVVFMPFYLPASRHVQDQFNASASSPSKDVIPLYPYSPHPVSVQEAFGIYTYILSNLRDLLPQEIKLPVGITSRGESGIIAPTRHSAMAVAVSTNPMKTRYKIDLCLSGSFIGGSIASVIGLTEFKHNPFLSGTKYALGEEEEEWEVEEDGTYVPPVNTKTPEELVVHLASLALIEPMVSWVFPPLGGYNFDPDVDEWMLPPLPPLPKTGVTTLAKGVGSNESLIPTPTLTELLHLRSHHFRGCPEEYTDHHASPLLFFQTPGVEVGKESLGKLFIGMEAERKAELKKLREEKRMSNILTGAPTEKYGQEDVGSYYRGEDQNEKVTIVTMDGTRRSKSARRWPPTWTEAHLLGRLEVPRGGLPRRGRCLILLKEYKSPSSPGRNIIDMNPQPAAMIRHYPEKSALFETVLDDYEEYTKDMITLGSYERPQAAHLAELKNPQLMMPKIVSTKEPDVAKGWLGPRAREFSDGVERAWRAVVGKLPRGSGQVAPATYTVVDGCEFGEKDKRVLAFEKKGEDSGIIVVKVKDGEEVKTREMHGVQMLGKWIGNVSGKPM